MVSDGVLYLGVQETIEQRHCESLRTIRSRMVREQMMDLRKYIAPEARLLTISGFYPQSKPTMMHYFRASVVLFVTIFAVIHYYLNLSNENQDVLELTSCVLYVVGTSFIVWKYMAFLKTGGNILKLEEILASPILCEYSVTKENIFEETVNSKFFPICKGIGIAFTIVANTLEIKCGFERKLFLPLKVFGSLENNVICFYYVIFQVSFSMLITWNYVLIDVLCCKMMSIATATLTVLKNNLENIPYENQNFDFLVVTFKKNIILHKEILRFTSLIEESFSFVILTIILSGALINCICGIIILKVS
ncbi:unnamed protein product [Phaedon cochleariae]|uniref:Odorant receptor n=1 Tax=Phaedon cochleariae TaxID=80249 RepID=A0A9P0GPH4_PHACE|nr:unnamed protein product [Phaedon cochleariae]